jgi:hypothetical protein
MSKVSKHSILFYSGEEGYLNNLVPITVSDSMGNTTGFVRFKDPGMPYDLDKDDNGIITMLSLQPCFLACSRRYAMRRRISTTRSGRRGGPSRQRRARIPPPAIRARSATTVAGSKGARISSK